MMKQMQKSVVALALCGAISAPAMAASTDVKVTGTITPAGCTPVLAGGGVIDYGNIRADDLSATNYTVLQTKQIDFSITCNAPAKVAVKAVDGRADTAAGATQVGHGGIGFAPVNLFGQPQIFVAGLGMDGAKRIGGYGIRIANVTADGKSVDGIRSLDAASSWSPGQFGEIYSSVAQNYQSWAATGTLIPVAVQSLSGKLEVQAYLNKASQLDLTKPVALDGLTTIELVYL